LECEVDYGSAVLVDPSGLAKTVSDLMSHPMPLELLDFCTLIEALILYDELHLAGGLALPARLTDPLAPLIEAGVLVDHRTTPLNAGLPPGFRSRASGPHARMPLGNSSIEDAYYECGRLIAGESSLGIPALPMLRQGPLIALEVVKDSKGPSDALSRALDRREDFAPLRKRIREARAIVADDTVSLIKKRKLMDKWKESWLLARQIASSANGGFIAIATTILPFLSANIDASGAVAPQLSVAKLLQSLVQLAPRAVNTGRLRLIHRTTLRYLRATDQEIICESAKLLGRPLSESDFRDFASLAKAGGGGRERWGAFDFYAL
jgi:hypothetical protein